MVNIQFVLIVHSKQCVQNFQKKIYYSMNNCCLLLSLLQ